MDVISQRPLLALIIVFLAIALIRWLYYHIYCLRTEDRLKLFESYFSPNSISSNEYKWDLAERQTEIKRLFQKAGLEEPHVLHTQQVQNVGIASVPMSAWDNLTLLEKEVIDINRMCFHRAIGAFRQRRNETLSLVFWIEFLLFHPRNLLDYLGIVKGGIVANLFNVLALIAEIIAIYEWFIKQLA